jgi:hypothetical protein
MGNARRRAHQRGSEKAAATFLRRMVHPLSLAISPGVIGLSEPMLDALFDPHAIEDVRVQEAAAEGATLNGI